MTCKDNPATPAMSRGRGPKENHRFSSRHYQFHTKSTNLRPPTMDTTSRLSNDPVRFSSSWCMELAGPWFWKPDCCM